MNQSERNIKKLTNFENKMVFNKKVEEDAKGLKKTLSKRKSIN